jgi:hypothetical protein
MTRFGFSTGALAFADFREGLRMSHGRGFDAVELSALRAPEVAPLLDAVQQLDLNEYEYVSVHAPSNFQGFDEAEIARALFERLPASWPVVLHTDASSDLSLWAPFGDRLLVENMDKRKAGARFASELEGVFAALPAASLCFDIGHARQVDSTMLEAYRILHRFGDRLREIHISEVNTASRHERLSYPAVLAFRDVAWLLQEHPDVAVILETPVEESEMQQQAEMALDALGLTKLQHA